MGRIDARPGWYRHKAGTAGTAGTVGTVLRKRGKDGGDGMDTSPKAESHIRNISNPAFLLFCMKKARKLKSYEIFRRRF